MSNEFHIFDVCGTLFYEDTTMGLLEWHFRRQHRLFPWLAIAALSGRMSPVRYFAMLLERVVGGHLAKHLAIGLLAGDSPAALQVSARDYVDYLLHKRKIACVFDKFCSAALSGRAILASGSLEPVIREIAERFQVDFVSSRLELHGGRYTGRLAFDLTGVKDKVLVERFGSEVLGPESRAYTDNLSDREFLARIGRRFVIVHSMRQFNRWNMPDAQFLWA